MNFSKESLFLCSNELFGRKRLFCCCRLIYVDPLLKCKFNVCKFSQNDYFEVLFLCVACACRVSRFNFLGSERVNRLLLFSLIRI